MNLDALLRTFLYSDHGRDMRGVVRTAQQVRAATPGLAATKIRLWTASGSAFVDVTIDGGGRVTLAGQS